MKVPVLQIKVFEVANAAALETAFDTWRKAAGEVVFVGTELTHDGTNIVLAVFYTRG